MTLQHEMRLLPRPFGEIKAGRKRIEIRIDDEKRRALQAGDTILFRKRPELREAIEAEVVALHRFPSFERLIDALPLDAIGASGMTKEEALASMREHYGEDEERAHGVVGIELRLV